MACTHTLLYAHLHAYTDTHSPLKPIILTRYYGKFTHGCCSRIGFPVVPQNYRARYRRVEFYTRFHLYTYTYIILYTYNILYKLVYVLRCSYIHKYST